MEPMGKQKKKKSEELRILHHSMVLPHAHSTPPIRHPDELFLSSLDLLWRPFGFASMLFFYSTDQPDALISTLQDSLAHVLVPFFPAAGRLAPSRHYKDRVCILCNDAGVEFTVASADALDFHELEARSFRPCPALFSKLVPYHDVQPSGGSSSDIFSLPLLAIQVTKFRSGRGVVLGAAHSHVLLDAESWCHFLRLWAQCARKVPIDMPPLHMRWALAVERPLVEKAFLPYPPEGSSVVDVQISKACTEPLVETYFPHSGEVIQKLKQAANATDHHVHAGSNTASFHKNGDDDKGLGANAKKFSSYEAMCAYWWKLITRARQLDGATVVRFGVLSNMRARLKPKLPPAYFGNAIITAYAYARADEILQESLGSTASRIRQASLASSPEAMWSIIHWLELHGQAYDAKYFSHVPSVRTICSPHFPLYDVDCGYGRPVAVRQAKINGDGDMVLFPPRDGGSKGGVDMFLALSREATKRLQEDPCLIVSLLCTPASKPFSGFSKM